jgi:hypothetical protein
VLEGGDGAKAVGWPAFHQSTQHTSPLLYDIDIDGVADILVSTYNGEILFFKDTVRGLLGWRWSAGGAAAAGAVGGWCRRGRSQPQRACCTGSGVAQQPATKQQLQRAEPGARRRQPPAPPQGERMAETLKVPRLKVRRNWFVGLNPDPVNRSPDVDKADAALEKELKVGGLDGGAGASGVAA